MNKKHQAINRVRQWVASFFARQSQHICPCFHTVLQLYSGCAFLRRLKEYFSCSSGDSTQRSGAIAYNNANPTEDADLSGKSPEELAAYVFEHHRCNNCRTMGAAGKLGFNERGKGVGKGFEGCISLLTSMNVIAQVKPANRTDDEKHKVARFEQFGCTTCHQIVPGKLGLTSYRQKLKSMHMACTDVKE